MQPSPEPTFRTFCPSFDTVLGTDARIELLCSAGESDLSWFHEACIYHPKSCSIFVTSNQLVNDSEKQYEPTSNKHVKLFRIFDGPKPYFEEVKFPGSDTAMLNGGTNDGDNSLLFCAQGSRASTDISGIISVPVEGGDPTILVADFHDRPFNSVNDVIVHPEDGSIWFTDPSYGYGQGIRNKPVLPNQLYRFDRNTKGIRAMAHGFMRPNGLCFSPDLKTLYVTDTGAIHGASEVPFNPAGESHIYAFDIVDGPFLANKRLFAYAPGKLPDGIKCDTAGNVYSGCGDGVEIWNQLGTLIGLIAIEGGCANLCFGEQGVLYACNEDKFWKISLNQAKVQGALLGI